jgi:hypothetical protein
MLACAENQEENNSICKGDGSCSSDESERLDQMFIAIIFPFHLIRKQQTHDNTKLQSEKNGTGK